MCCSQMQDYFEIESTENKDFRDINNVPKIHRKVM